MKALGPEHPGIARSYNTLGSLYDAKGSVDKAIEHHEKCLEILLKVHGTRHPHVASSYNNLALIHLKKGDKAKAREHLLKARSILMKTLGPGSIKTKNVQYSLDQLE